VSAASHALHLRLALVIALLPTIAFVLHDFVFQLPDNEGEATLGLFLTIAGLLCVWAYGGHVLARPVEGVGARLATGALTGLASVGVLWVTFILLNAFFLDRMSYEPDRIRAFQQSGYSTMREYWNHQIGLGPFPLAMLIAAIAGAVGGIVQRHSSRRGRV
jgi:hypothetical protein